jgi:hypothetical protein
MSEDPMSIVYNTSLVTDKVTGLKSLADIVAKDPAKFTGKITTRDVAGAFGFTVSHAFARGAARFVVHLEKLLPLGKAESCRARSWRRSRRGVPRRFLRQCRTGVPEGRRQRRPAGSDVPR